jgi:crotonobetainyl-CoA:carnitine CoA-transferase CaiB-like acyl-CoA transferase
MLSPFRVLDLTNERGLLAGQMLADLGADVIQIEPPGGSSARRLGPFAQDEVDPERSLYWWAYARNKRGVTLDLDHPEGQELFRRLAASADFVLESETPGVMETRGLAYADIAAINSRMVYVSITPFGQDGPKAGYADCDLVLMAAGGPLLMSGYPDRAPMRVSVPQAYHHAAGDAAGAALIAHLERQRSGEGQHVDVSAQQAVTTATMSSLLTAPLNDAASPRASGGWFMKGFNFRLIWEAKDGYISLTHLFGSAAGPFTRRLMEWIYDEGGCDAATRDKDWIAYFQLLFTGEEPREEFERVKQLVEDFVKTKTKVEHMAAAMERKLLIVPVTTVSDVAQSEQLADRDYWRTIDHEDGQSPVRYPGPFVRYSDHAIQYRRRAPLLGEHNVEVLVDELGVASAELAALQDKGVVA